MLSEARLNFKKKIVLFMYQKVLFGPQNIVWGLNFGAQGGPGPWGPLGSATAK